MKQCAGKRKQTIYSNVAMPTGSQYAAAMPSVPVNVELGGVTVFVMDLEKLENSKGNQFPLRHSFVLTNPPET